MIKKLAVTVKYYVRCRIDKDGTGSTTACEELRGPFSLEICGERRTMASGARPSNRRSPGEIKFRRSRRARSSRDSRPTPTGAGRWLLMRSYKIYNPYYNVYDTFIYSKGTHNTLLRDKHALKSHRETRFTPQYTLQCRSFGAGGVSGRHALLKFQTTPFSMRRRVHEPRCSPYTHTA